MLSLAQPVACIFLVSTIPEARQQGIGTAMTRRLGFQEYGKSSIYIWSGSPGERDWS
jgi:hypothetical protein